MLCFQDAEHNYAVLDTPKTLKRKLDACTDSAAAVKRKLKLSLERERRLRRRVETFNEIIDDLKQKEAFSFRRCLCNVGKVLHGGSLGSDATLAQANSQ